jgi:PadR family transcriptional regulator PadR
VTKRHREKGLRITLPTAALLRQMLQGPAEDHCGFDLAERIGIPSGTIYPILARLEAAGWLDSFWEVGGLGRLGRPRRRMYKLTGVGAHAARNALSGAQFLLGLPALSPSDQGMGSEGGTA